MVHAGKLQTTHILNTKFINSVEKMPSLFLQQYNPVYPSLDGSSSFFSSSTQQVNF